MTDEAIFGTDIINTFEIGPNGDFKTVSGIDNAEQRIYNRTMTKMDELDEFGYDSYGNESWDVLGETDKKIVESKTEIYEESCLKKEPVVEDIIDISVSFDGKIIIVEVEVKLIEQTNTNNLVFGLGVS